MERSHQRVPSKNPGFPYGMRRSDFSFDISFEVYRIFHHSAKRTVTLHSSGLNVPSDLGLPAVGRSKIYPRTYPSRVPYIQDGVFCEIGVI